eukprot:gene3529-9239_t
MSHAAARWGVPDRGAGAAGGGAGGGAVLSADGKSSCPAAAGDGAAPPTPAGGDGTEYYPFALVPPAGQTRGGRALLGGGTQLPT